MNDTAREEIRGHFQETGDWLESALRRRGNRVLVNCWQGASRYEDNKIPLPVVFLLAPRWFFMALG